MAFIAATRLNNERIAPTLDDEDGNEGGLGVSGPHGSPHGANRRSMAYAKSDQEAEMLAIGDWRAEKVMQWLTSLEWKEVGQACLDRGVDGSTLICMSVEGWQELGVKSAIDRSKLQGLVKKASLSALNVPHPSLLPGVTRQDPYEPSGLKKAKEVSDFFCATWTPFNCKLSRTTEGGAEHRLDWVLAIANAHKDPAVVKQHILRFLGMYNVIDLLVLTIDFAYIITLGVAGGSCETVIDSIILSIMCLSAVLGGMGMIGSTILYNTASGVSDANFIVFAKLPAVLHYLKAVNDYSIHSGNALCFSIFAWLYKICVENGDTPWADKWQYCVCPIVLCFYVFFGICGRSFMIFVPASTNLAMFGGLFNEEPIAPLRDDPTWAHRTSPTEIGEWVSAEAVAMGANDDHDTVGADCADYYARTTIDNMHGESREAKGAEGLISAALGISIVSKTSKVKKSSALPLNPTIS